MTMVRPDRAALAERQATLARAAAALKQELFGIDDVIDRVIEALRGWYVLPQAVRRPVIVCLWGLTGTGKTQLVRSLARLLGFYDRFVEVQMDGFSNGSDPLASSISGMLAESGIEEGEPGILALDEFQRYRTIDKEDKELRVERYQDVWGLLSDGRLAPSLSFMHRLETSLAYAQYDQDDKPEEAPADGNATRRARFQLSPYEASSFKRSLKLKEPLLEIMAWSPQQVQERMLAFRRCEAAWETDYSRLLVFVSGNLDEMYEGLASRVEDCDTDADIFHLHTRRLSLIDVKRALRQRFKPEQIARLGNNHVIYPSLSRSAYQALIAQHCARHGAELEASTGVRIAVSHALREEIYANGVFPAQGTRPLFSTIQAALDAPLVDAALWVLETLGEGAPALTLDFDARADQLVLCAGAQVWRRPAGFEVRRLRQRANANFRTLLAVHEAGHGLVHSLLTGEAPEEIRINVASFEGGYNSYASLPVQSRRATLDMVCTTLAGRAAECLVFGPDRCTTGAEQDLRKATQLAARFVRHWGFDERLARTDVTHDMDDNVSTDVEPTNPAIDALLRAQMARATKLLAAHRPKFHLMVEALCASGTIDKQDLHSWLGWPAPQGRPAAEGQIEDYAARWAAFGQAQDALTLA